MPYLLRSANQRTPRALRTGLVQNRIKGRVDCIYFTLIYSTVKIQDDTIMRVKKNSAPPMIPTKKGAHEPSPDESDDDSAAGHHGSATGGPRRKVMPERVFDKDVADEGTAPAAAADADDDAEETPATPAAAPKTPKKGRAMFSRKEELQMTTFLKNRPSLYETGSPEYLPRLRKAKREAVWEELVADMPTISAVKMEQWYWSTRTLYGKCLKDPPPPAPLQDVYPTRAQFIVDAWAFHKHHIKKAVANEDEPSLITSPTPSAGSSKKAVRRRRPAARADDSSSSDNEEDHPTSKKARHERDPKKRLASALDEMVGIKRVVEADPEENARKMLMDAMYMETLQRLPAKMWSEFLEDFQELIKKYRGLMEEHLEKLEQARLKGLHLYGGGRHILPTIMPPSPPAQQQQQQPGIQPPQPPQGQPAYPHLPGY